MKVTQLKSDLLYCVATRLKQEQKELDDKLWDQPLGNYYHLEQSIQHHKKMLESGEIIGCNF